MEEGTITVSKASGIGRLEFYHPLSNSLPGKLLAEMSDALLDLGKDEGVNAIVLSSRGEKAFCAGASFNELSAIVDFEQGKKFFMGFANLINACRKCGKIIIGRVQGKAVGGGVGLASATDYCLSTVHSAIKLSELAVGIGPFVVGPAVERKIGLSAMSQLAINASEWHSAEWARDRGLYAEIYENIAHLDEAVEVLAARLSSSNPEALRSLKQTFWTGTENWDQLLKERAAVSGNLVLSDFTKKAIAAFKSKS